MFISPPHVCASLKYGQKMLATSNDPNQLPVAGGFGRSARRLAEYEVGGDADVLSDVYRERVVARGFGSGAWAARDRALEGLPSRSSRQASRT
jgi:hypothetical protein